MHDPAQATAGQAPARVQTWRDIIARGAVWRSEAAELVRRFPILSYLAGLALVALVTVFGLLTHGLIASTNLVMLFLLAVVIVALRWGLGPAIFTAFASVVAFDFFLVPPRHTLAVSDTQYLLTFFGLLITGVVISSLAARARQRADEAVERAQLLEQAREAEVLRATEKLQTALLNSISHDLRTPLASITGAVSSLRDPEVQLDETTRGELIEDIATEADRLNRLVGNLLDMSRVEAGALHVLRESGEIAEVIGAALEQLSGPLKQRPLPLRVPRDLPPVLMSEPLVVQVMVNLLDNALKYSKDGTPVEVTAAVRGPMVAVEVADRGIGIPEGDERRIFDKFYRVQQPGRVSGTGLGLAIAKGIIEAHGGQISGERRPGGGSIFCFTLPVSEDKK
jgi:two-component system, OmpR family, sensor histidine kinase KdpD